MSIKLYSNLKCPKCGFVEKVKMPEDACQYFYKCKNCGYLMKPLEGDCCVFCSWGDVPCPPKQKEREVES